MKFLNNDKGIALVTSLMLTLLTLTISMVMLYMVLQSTQMSGAHKRYKNSLDAAVGGVDIVTMDVLPYLISFAADPTASTLISRLNASMNLSASTGVSDACLQAKLTSKTWGAACGTASSNINPKDAPDMTFTLASQFVGSVGYRVYTKIISTTPGSTDISGRNLEGQSTTGAPPGDVGAPYLYRIEVSSEKNTNPLEKANLSVLYAY
ncbi:MAG: hypothetical protein HGB32_02585 [Geobacteraceae bacterium]|nr:hypothetical protein [Geobacteraceae bacterium]NTW79020.1 hypothetical protein [Geobacteraceae bacterium]